MYDKSSSFIAAALDGELPLRTQFTLTMRIGTVPEWLESAAALLLCGITITGNCVTYHRTAVFV